MTEPSDARTIEHRISVFEARFAESLTRYAEFADVMENMNERIDRHLKFGEEVLTVARDEQKGVNRKSGLAGLFTKRNQGRINSKLVGAIERDFAIHKDIRNLTRDVRDLMDSFVETIRYSHEGIAQSLRFMAYDIEMLKQLTAKAYLKDAGIESKQDQNVSEKG